MAATATIAVKERAIHRSASGSASNTVDVNTPTIPIAGREISTVDIAAQTFRIRFQRVQALPWRQAARQRHAQIADSFEPPPHPLDHAAEQTEGLSLALQIQPQFRLSRELPVDNSCAQSGDPGKWDRLVAAISADEPDNIGGQDHCDGIAAQPPPLQLTSRSRDKARPKL
jgi:hypothetical protein